MVTTDFAHGFLGYDSHPSAVQFLVQPIGDKQPLTVGEIANYPLGWENLLVNQAAVTNIGQQSNRTSGYCPVANVCYPWNMGQKSVVSHPRPVLQRLCQVTGRDPVAPC